MKIVAGLSKLSLKSRVADIAIKNSTSPMGVDGWVEWFDCQPCDHNGTTDKKRCEGCQDKTHCEGAKE